MKLYFAPLLAALAPAVITSQSEVIQLHGSGTTNPSKCYWHIMDLIQTQTKVPTKMTYRAVGSSTGQAEFIGDVISPDNDFGSGDIPLSQEDFDMFPANSVLHLPIVMGAISFFHSVPTGKGKLNLSPCVLAQILNRDITDWSDDRIKKLNTGLNLPNPSPITVAHRVQGSSSTASITQYLNEACSDEWPSTLVGKTIDWKTGTVGCEGSGGMTDCITQVPGTIGYIDSGHGHSEGLQEIELRNADGNYISSKEAATRGGIFAATNNAGLPTSLDGSFANVNLLNRPGANTWPIVAVSYIYIRKDITNLSSDSQGLLKAFLKALYAEEYITTCEKEFGFIRITGDLRDKALEAIAALTTTDGSPEFTFEFNTEKRTGQDQYKISSKRQSYSEVEQGNIVDLVSHLEAQISLLKAESLLMVDTIAGLKNGDDHEHYNPSPANPSPANPSSSNPANQLQDEGDDWIVSNKDTQLKAALALGSVSFIFWMFALIYVIVKFVLHI